MILQTQNIEISTFKNSQNITSENDLMQLSVFNTGTTSAFWGKRSNFEIKPGDERVLIDVINPINYKTSMKLSFIDDTDVNNGLVVSISRLVKQECTI